MNIVFTICSVNYLASAKVLANSVLKTNSNVEFVYIISDKINDRVSKEYFEEIEFIEVENLGIENLNELVDTYNITEFNTALKPYAVNFLNKKYKSNKIIYIDPDIIVFHDLAQVFKNLDKYDFILTPHIINPIIDDEFYSHQIGALNTGVFNLGFVAINYNLESKKIIDWWALHMRNHGHCNSGIGEFYDQKIMNLLPVFSDKVLIEKNPGYNVAGWNIHERVITKNDCKFFVNNYPLVFYHFSGFVKDKSLKLISHYNHLTIEYNKHIKEILDAYEDALKNNNHNSLSKEKCFYKLKPNIHKVTRVQMLKYKLKKYFE